MTLHLPIARTPNIRAAPAQTLVSGATHFPFCFLLRKNGLDVNDFDDFVDFAVFGDGGGLGLHGSVDNGDFGGGGSFGGRGSFGSGSGSKAATQGAASVGETGCELTGRATLVRSTAGSVFALSRPVPIPMVETLVFVPLGVDIPSLENRTKVIRLLLHGVAAGDGEIETLGIVGLAGVFVASVAAGAEPGPEDCVLAVREPVGDCEGLGAGGGADGVVAAVGFVTDGCAGEFGASFAGLATLFVTVQVEDVTVVFVHCVGVFVLCDRELNKPCGVVHALPLLANGLATLPDGSGGVAGFFAGTAGGVAKHVGVPVGKLTETVRRADHGSKRARRLAQLCVSRDQGHQGQKSSNALHFCVCVLM